MLAAVVPINIVKGGIVPVLSLFNVLARVVAIDVAAGTGVTVADKPYGTDADTDSCPWCMLVGLLSSLLR